MRVVRAPRARQRRERAVPPDRRTLLRARLLAQMAADLPPVRHFRCQFLPDGLLQWEEVGDWIRAQAVQDGPPSSWVEFALPPGHRLEYDWESRMCRIVPPLDSLPLAGQSLRFLAFFTPDRPGEVQFIPVAAGGVLDRLRQVSKGLADSFGWQEASATVLVLTGQIPVISPLSISTHIHYSSTTTARIEISADPEVSPDKVKQFYQEVRKKVRGGRRYHPLAGWVMDLVEFVLDTPDLTWGERFEKWNREHPEHRYSVLQSMTNAYYRAVSKLLPDYYLP
ncbi:MAG: hypothetical protein RML46_12615 [Anaerolineae bacterium]|nr:hypothetical protein [Anaerolineae bacterium]